NSVAPHLHFHVMDGPSPLASNGMPYEIDAFEVVGHSPSTEAFDVAEERGTPLAVAPVTPAARVTRALPLDQSIIRFLQYAPGQGRRSALVETRALLGGSMIQSGPVAPRGHTG